MKKIIITFLISNIFLFSDIVSGNERIKYNFNYAWKVHTGDHPDAMKYGFDDKSWKMISLPYAWNEDDAFKKDIIDLSTGIAWYRKNFKLPKEHQGKKIFIEFEGVRQAGEIYVNEHYIGIHENGITAFGFDITDYVYFGKKENVIAVRTDNSWDYKEKSTGTPFQWNNKNFNANYGGIPKNVFLHITGKVYQTLPLFSNLQTTGTYIYATDFDIPGKSAVITAETEVMNESGVDRVVRYEVQIFDPDSNLIKVIDGGEYKIRHGEKKIFSATDQVNKLNFWSWGYGYLYKVYTILKQKEDIIDEVITYTGFRKTAFSDGMIWLNDRVIQIKGYAQRTSNEWPALGMSVSPWLSDFSNKLMVEGNANLVRWMHVAPWKQDVESCDRVGLMQAMPAGDSEKDATGRQWEQRADVMRDAIIYFRNNPSIIFYESGNKEISEPHMQEMKILRDIYDPYGGRAVGCREMLNSHTAEYGGEMLYVNKSDSMPVWAMEYMRDEGLRKYWDNYTFPFHNDGDGPLYKGQDASAYNRNQDSHATEAVKRWNDYFRERPGTGKKVSAGGVNIIFSDSNTHHRGNENYRRSGEVDAVRVAKDAYYTHQVIWNGWVDIENHGTYIIGHWNYEKGTFKDIFVISTGEKVELLLNNQSKGFGRKEHGFLFTFDSIAWEPGKIEAKSFNKNNILLSSYSIKTTGKPESIKLTLRSPDKKMKANGADMALVDVEVVDNNGIRCPDAFNLIQFEIEGPVNWRGGIAQGPDNYILSKSIPVECGINRVVLRSTYKEGMVKITAHAEGLKPSSFLFQIAPFFSINGLSTEIPGESLPLNFERGPTPATPSFQISRKSVNIISATAGSNNEKAVLSYDGNQNTQWTNDGILESGWIEYTLEKEARVSEIALKLGGWRTQSYPIAVFAAGNLIYLGLTMPNLGYFYIIPETPLKTNNIKIRLIGDSKSTDLFTMDEISKKTDTKTENDPVENNSMNLNIVEVEVFEKP